MQASLLIVSKNRKEELKRTLSILSQLIDSTRHEILVFLDGCTDGSEALQSAFPLVKWKISTKSIGASAARHSLYPNATGTFLIGLDDDAHPLQTDFIEKVVSVFDLFPNVGIIAFEEIRGIFTSDEEALQNVRVPEEQYLTNDFIGCGFAIRTAVYNNTNGFPLWIDIYGEESCLAIEVLSNGFDILYEGSIKINHRVDMVKRRLGKQNYFRFGKQLKNTTFYYLVYYPSPMGKILKLYWHNLKKYALTDFKCFRIYCSVLFQVLFSLPKILSLRNSVDASVISRIKLLRNLKY